MFFYLDCFDTHDLKSIIDNEEKIQNTIIDSPFYQSFMNENGELIESPYITGKIIPVNMNFMSHKLKNDDEITKYYQSKGINCDFSKEQQEYKDELLYFIKKQEKVKVKSLLEKKK